MQPAPTTPPRLAPLVLAAMAAQSVLIVLAPTLVEVGRGLGVSVGVVGQARAIAAVSAVAASVAIACLIGRVGLRRLLAAGAALAVVGSAATAAASSLTVFLAAHIVSGVAFACLFSAGLAGVAAFPREQSARAMGRVVGANALAWIVVGPAGGLLTDVVSWRAAYAVPAALALGALATVRCATPLPVAHVRGSRSGLAAVVEDRRARGWLVAELAAWFAWAGMLTYGGAFLIERHSMSEGMAGVAFAAAAGAFFLGSVRSARLVRRFGRRSLIASAATAMAALIPLHFGLASSVWVTVASLCLIALLAGARSSASAGLGLAQLPARPGAMMTAQTAVVQLGYLLGALTGAALLGSSGYAALGLALGAGLLVSALLFTHVADPLDERAKPHTTRRRTDLIAVKTA